MAKIKHMLRTYPRMRKSDEPLFWILCKIMEIPCFSVNFRQCSNIAYSVVLLILLLFVLAFLSALAAVNQ